MSAAFAAGAGVIGDYRECSFAIPGEGTFFGTEATDPAVGQKGRRETVAELRLEFVCPADRLAAVAGRDPGPAFVRGARDRRLSAARRSRETSDDRTPSGPAGWAGSSGRRAWRSSRRRSGGRWTSRASRSWAIRGGRSDRVAVCCGAGDDFLQGRRARRRGRPAHRRGAVPPRPRGRGPRHRPDHRRPPRHRADRRRGPGRTDRRGVPRARGLAEPVRARSLPARRCPGIHRRHASSSPEWSRGEPERNFRARRTPGRPARRRIRPRSPRRRDDPTPGRSSGLLLRLHGGRSGPLPLRPLRLRPSPACAGRAVGNGRNIWCSHCPDQNWPVHFCSEIVRTVGRSSSRITSPHAPGIRRPDLRGTLAHAEQTLAVGDRQATARQS